MQSQRAADDETAEATGERGGGEARETKGDHEEKSESEQRKSGQRTQNGTDGAGLATACVEIASFLPPYLRFKHINRVI